MLITSEVLCWNGVKGIYLAGFNMLSLLVQGSEVHGVQCEVLQGSISRPLLFILQVNDACNVAETFFAIMYADDTSFL